MLYGRPRTITREIEDPLIDYLLAGVTTDAWPGSSVEMFSDELCHGLPTVGLTWLT
jgi:hypothetical protein